MILLQFDKFRLASGSPQRPDCLYPFRLSWRDSDGDDILVSSDVELDAALAAMDGPVFRLSLVPDRQVFVARKISVVRTPGGAEEKSK